MRTSGNEAASLIFVTPGNSPLKYVAATLSSLTSLTRLSITITARLCTSMLRSFRALIKRGARTTSAGAVTSAMNVVEDRAFIASATSAGSAMQETRIGM